MKLHFATDFVYPHGFNRFTDAREAKWFMDVINETSWQAFVEAIRTGNYEYFF